MTQSTRTAAQIGVLVRRERRKQGLTQADLGLKSGMRQATISRLESGEPAIQLQTLLDVLAALQLELNVSQREEFDLSELERLF